MRLEEEKREFAVRLRRALARSAKPIDTPSDLALQFNLRYPMESVSRQAAQSWLSGRSVPALDKIETIAAWLDVPALWLLHGVADRKKGKKTGATGSSYSPPTAAEKDLLYMLRSLPEHRRKMVTDLVRNFFLDEEMWTR